MRIGIGVGLLIVLLGLLIATPYWWSHHASPVLVALPESPWASPGGRTDPTTFSYNLTAGRQVVDCKASLTGRSAAVVTLGQSLMGNTGDPNGFFDPGPNVFNFNWIDQKCYVAKEPLLGTTKADANQTIRIGAHLVSRKIYDSVVLIPLANGGTYVKEWAPGGDMNLRLTQGLRFAMDAGLVPTLVLWEQGQAEAGSPPQPPSKQAWIAYFQAMVRSIRADGVEAPIYVARSTVCRNAGSPVIRDAQAAVVNGIDVRAGPDIDVIPISDRWDGCHLGVAGLQKAAELWFAALMQDERRMRTDPAATASQD